MSTNTQNNPPVGYVSRDASFARMTTNLPEGSLLYAAPVAAQPDHTQQTLDDVKAGIPARDAEIEALRKEIEALQAAQAGPLDVRPLEITDGIALAFHNAITDGSVGQQELDDIKIGLLAAFTIISDMRPLAQQPVSGADGLPIELLGIAEAIGNGGGFWRSCSGCHESNEGMATGPFSETLKCHLGIGCSECGGIGAIWDTTDYDAMADFMAAEYQQRTENTEPVGQGQLRDAAQMIEPCGNSGELDELKAFEIELRRQCFRQPTHEARDLAWCMWRARAALAQQDAALHAEVLNMVLMLEANEWADHCGKSDLGRRLEWAITALQNRIAELTKSSNQQDADKVQADLLSSLVEIVDAVIASDEEGLIEHSEIIIKARAAIDAARKEPDQ